MAINHDFSWAEVGTRIRDRRLRQGLSQQALAEAAGLTQNGVFRLEAGETNPQLTTLRQIATALGCSVRDLVVGMDFNDSVLARHIARARTILESADQAAISAMNSGLQNAELLLERSGSRRGLPPLRIKGQGRRSSADELRWMTPRVATRSETSQIIHGPVVRKANKPFRNSSTIHQAGNKNAKH